MSEAGEIRLTAAWVADVMKGVIRSGGGSEFSGVSIDTRTLSPGELFVGIRGENFDGARFAGAAIEAGAAGIVVPSGVRVEQERPSVVVIEVDDTTAALQALARAVRRKSGAKVVAITGSAGKTTTKEVTAEFLASRYRVIRNHGNFNNHIGLPLSLIELRRRPEIAVVELGMNHAGEIRTLAAIAEPDVRVWTNVGEAHLGFFASVDAIADAKAEIFEGATSSTLLVANADDARIESRVPRFPGRLVTFGIDHQADVRATDVVDKGIGGTSATLRTAAGVAHLETPLVGRGNLLNVLAAAAVALDFDVPLAEIARRAGELRPASRRGEVVSLEGAVTLIDDSYNANPSATKRSLETLVRSDTAGRRIAVLGEMLELGDTSPALHAEVGRTAAALGIDVLLTVGGQPAVDMANAAIAAGLPREHVRHFTSSAEAAEAAVALVGPGDLVLVKGSRGVRTDKVVDQLRARRGERG